MIEFEPEAQSEFSDSMAWYAKRSARAALEFEDAVDAAIKKIEAHPDQFPQTHARCRYCLLLQYPFSLIFLQLPGIIKIVAVAHSSRHQDYWHHRV
jgi:plasmid stabilization system protein ParE